VIPVIGSGRGIAEEMDLKGESCRGACLSVGNPQWVIFGDDVDGVPVGRYGPRFENHPAFPRRTNVECVEVLSKDELKVRVWERGVGETLACGAGACASVVAARLTGRASGKCNVHLRGGALRVEFEGNRILMSGSAEKAFEGVVDLQIQP